MGAGGREVPIRASGCLLLSCAKVSGVSSAIFSSDDNSRIAPGMSIFANLTLIRFASSSSLDFDLEVAFLGGQERSSGGNFELEKSVNWDLILVAKEGLLGEDFSLFGFLRPWEAKQSSFAHAWYELDSRTSVMC